MKTEQTSKKYLTDIHKHHVEWINNLSFYKEDLKTFLNRLEEVTKKNNSSEVLSKVEHFQNQFIIQRNHMDELLHDIKIKEKILVDYAATHPVAIDHVRFDENQELMDRVTQFEKIWKDLRKEYLDFIAKWM